MDGGCRFENVSYLLLICDYGRWFRSGLADDVCVDILSRWIDLMGNVHGRVEGMNSTAQALLIGSHAVIALGKTLLFV